jgi:hypothetical protein
MPAVRAARGCLPVTQQGPDWRETFQQQAGEAALGSRSSALGKTGNTQRRSAESQNTPGATPNAEAQRRRERLQPGKATKGSSRLLVVGSWQNRKQKGSSRLSVFGSRQNRKHPTSPGKRPELKLQGPSGPVFNPRAEAQNVMRLFTGPAKRDQCFHRDTATGFCPSLWVLGCWPLATGP